MLIVPPEVQRRQHHEAKTGLLNHFNDEMEKILNQNTAVDKYWILGKVRFPDNAHVGKVFLEACLEKPPLVKEAFLYEVDNRRGVKTLLWVMHPGGELSLPTIGKRIGTEKKGVKKTRPPLVGVAANGRSK